MPPSGPACPSRSIILVGLMGAGKTCIGRRLASRLNLPFVDGDAEIEAAAGHPIEEIFARHGEAAFRDGERRVIARLLAQPPQVLAAGGGAFHVRNPQSPVRSRPGPRPKPRETTWFWGADPRPRSTNPGDAD